MKKKKRVVKGWALIRNGAKKPYRVFLDDDFVYAPSDEKVVTVEITIVKE